MSAPFAAALARLNAAVVARLANATATIDGAAVDGKFESGYFGGMAVEGASPTFECLTADVPTAAHGTPVVIGPVTYQVCEIKPDGHGLITLRLEQQ